jgi:Zn-dependent protease
VAVQNITLFMFGGVSNIQREPDSPAEELFITIVGPLTSLFLGALFLVIGAGGYLNEAMTPTSLLGRLQPMNTILAWLGSINIMVGFFNLIPAFPLDGGRIVRSLFWAISGDVRIATRWASLLGQAIGWSMILGGLVMSLGVHLPVFGTGLFNGLWLIFIGWFLHNAAAAGYKHVVVQEVLNDVPVRNVMQTHIPVIPSDVQMNELIASPSSKDRTMLVTEGSDVVGMLAMNEIEKSSKQIGSSLAVSDVMTPVSELVYVTPDQGVAEAFDHLQRLDLRQMPVVRNNQIVGLLRRKDILRWLQLNSEFKM